MFLGASSHCFAVHYVFGARDVEVIEIMNHHGMVWEEFHAICRDWRQPTKLKYIISSPEVVHLVVNDAGKKLYEHTNCLSEMYVVS